MKKLLLALALAAFAPTLAHAQVDYSGAALVHDFSDYRGLGLAPGGGGALDSSAWFTDSGAGSCALGATCPAVAPPTVPTGPFYGGASAGGVTVASLYSFDIGAGLGSNPALGVQANASTYTPGTLTAAYRNATGAQIRALNVSYVFAENNDTAGSVSVTVSLDPDGPGAAAPVAIGALSDASTGPIGIVPGWQSRPHATTLSLTATPIPVGAQFTLIFTVNDTAGSVTSVRDEIALDDVRIAPATVLGACGDGVVQAGEDCDGGAAANDCCTDTCDYASAGSSCNGAPSGTCDAQDTCNTTGDCISNFAPRTTVCRAAAGTCDVAESCTGASTVCPVDVIRPSTFVCRAAASAACDVAESCTGSSVTCPANVVVPNGTSCADTLVCNGSEACLSGTCRAGTPLACNDGDACTADMCTEPGGCGAAPIPGCCNVASDCNDGNACTMDTCSGPGGTCVRSPVPGCCNVASDCNDGDACTTDSCSGPGGTCMASAVPGCCNPGDACDDGDVCTTDTCSGIGGMCLASPVTGCCEVSADCADGNVCTTNTCNTTTNRCEVEAVAGCCAVASDCDDDNACTTDSCDVATGACGNAEITGCCLSDGDCDDGDVCSTDSCDANVCGAEPILGCCTADVDCDDGDPCTTDSCDANLCDNAAIPGCGVDGGMPGEDAGMPDGGVPGEDAGVPDGGVPGDDAGMPGTDAGRDAGVPAGDTGPRDGGGLDGGGVGVDAGTTGGVTGGCGCRTSSGGSSGAALSLLGLLAVVLRARRKR